MNDFGHIGVVTGMRKILSPCHNAEPRRVDLEEVDGITEFKEVCSECGKEYEATEFQIN